LSWLIAWVRDLAKVIIAGHAFVQNVRRGHYELAVEAPVNRRGGHGVGRVGRSDLIAAWAYSSQHALSQLNATEPPAQQ
jgi:hypothetical protein